MIHHVPNMVVGRRQRNSNQHDMITQSSQGSFIFSTLEHNDKMFMPSKVFHDSEPYLTPDLIYQTSNNMLAHVVQQYILPIGCINCLFKPESYQDDKIAHTSE